MDIDTDAQEHEMDMIMNRPNGVDDDFFSDDTVCDGKDSDYFQKTGI